MNSNFFKYRIHENEFGQRSFNQCSPEILHEIPATIKAPAIVLPQLYIT